MTERPERIRTIRSWVLKAENDFKNAEHTLRMRPDECPYDTVCFHAQQTVEKYLKALLVSEAIDFPKTHDIGELVDLLPTSLKPPLNIEEQDKLSEYAIAGRYPEDIETITADEASEVMAAARRARDWARTLLPPPTLAF